MKTGIILLLFLSTGLSSAQVIPSFSGETADRKSFHVPSDIKGKYTILCFAMSRKAEPALETWLEPIYNTFIAKTGLMDDLYDVHVFFIPVFGNAGATFKETFKKKFRETAQEDLWPHILFSNGNLDEVIRSLGIGNSDAPCFFLLNKDGKIIYRAQGAYNEDAMDHLEDLIEI